MTTIQIRLIEYGLIALALLAAYGAWHHHVYKQGWNDAVAAQQRAIEEGKKQYDKKSSEVRHLSDDALRKRYCVWMRDDPDACLKGDTPFIK